MFSIQTFVVEFPLLLTWFVIFCAFLVSFDSFLNLDIPKGISKYYSDKLFGFCCFNVFEKLHILSFFFYLSQCLSYFIFPQLHSINLSATCCRVYIFDIWTKWSQLLGQRSNFKKLWSLCPERGVHGLSTRAHNMIEFRKGLIIFDNYNSFPHLRTGRPKMKVLMRSKLRRYKDITQNVLHFGSMYTTASHPQPYDWFNNTT